MNETLSHHGKFIHPHRVFTIFKWSVYLLLAWNAVQFFQEDFAASAETFGNTITWRNLVEAYSATIDTVAWLLLLLIFEFETAIIPDEKLKGRLAWVLLAIKSVCYFFIVYALYGYVSKYFVITDLLPFTIADVCSLVGTDWNYVVALDDYPPIDEAACTAIQGQELLQVSGTEIIGTREAMNIAWGLAVVDIVNASTWIAIVMLLQLEVLLQLGDRLTDRMLSVGKYLKGLLYLVLFLCAVYWGFEGSFLDFWDAFLWLVAFIFIELNIFQWHEEVEEEKDAERASAAQGSS